MPWVRSGHEEHSMGLTIEKLLKAEELGLDFPLDGVGA